MKGSVDLTKLPPRNQSVFIQPTRGRERQAEHRVQAGGSLPVRDSVSSAVRAGILPLIEKLFIIVLGNILGLPRWLSG